MKSHQSAHGNAPHPPTPGGLSATRDIPGTIKEFRFLGHNNSSAGGMCWNVYSLQYTSAVAGGCIQSAKLYVPIGDPPEQGWPTSVWIHGLGDPVTQLRRWPLVGTDWKTTRGVLAGSWARNGVVTLCPWLPGDGPSEPLGTYSPLSLERNAQAVLDALTALCNLNDSMESVVTPPGTQASALRLDTFRIVLRTDCVATPVLVHFAAHRLHEPVASRIVAFVADDFQPSIAYNETYLGPFVCRLDARPAAAIRCIWSRLIWALCLERGWPLGELFTPQAIELLGEPRCTPVGLLPRIMASVLVPPANSELATGVVVAIEKDLRRVPTGRDVRDWIYCPAMRELADQPSITAFVRHTYYQQYLAASDPFFAETIAPFAASVPLLVVPRAGRAVAGINGLPTFDSRFRHMTLPKLSTLEAWGWNVVVCPSAHCDGPSFAAGAAERWVVKELQSEYWQVRGLNDLADGH